MKSPLRLVSGFLGINKNERRNRRAIRELRMLNDRELSDMGLSRSAIEHAVRFGRDIDKKAA